MSEVGKPPETTSKAKEESIMSERDKYGNYVNDKGVTIKVTTDKNGKDHISCYDGPVDGGHSAVHVNIDYRDDGHWTSQTHGPDHSESDRGSGGCFLTSACMNALSDTFDDNCYELRTLRWFRDNHVAKADIDRYYEIAPTIVECISKRDDSHEIYKRIYDTVVHVCVEAIEAGNFTLAYDVYPVSYTHLRAHET